MTIKKLTLTLAISAALASAPAYSMLKVIDTEQEIESLVEDKEQDLSERERIIKDREAAAADRAAAEKAKADRKQSERERIRKEREAAAAARIAQEKAEIEQMQNQRERIAAQKEAELKRQEQAKLEQKRLEKERQAREAAAKAEAKKQAKERQAREAAAKAEAKKQAKMKGYANQAVALFPKINDPKNFGDLRSVYGKMWKLDSKSGYTREVMHKSAEILAGQGHRALTRIADAYNNADSSAQKERYAKQVPDFIDLADQFLEESHFYLRESPEQTKLENRIIEFRTSFNVQNTSSTKSKKSSTETPENNINEMASKAGDVAKKAGGAAVDVTKKAWSGASEMGSKVADRLKNACWYNCD